MLKKGQIEKVEKGAGARTGEIYFWNLWAGGISNSFFKEFLALNNFLQRNRFIPPTCGMWVNGDERANWSTSCVFD